MKIGYLNSCVYLSMSSLAKNASSETLNKIKSHKYPIYSVTLLYNFNLKHYLKTCNYQNTSVTVNLPH